MIALLGRKRLLRAEKIDGSLKGLRLHAALAHAAIIPPKVPMKIDKLLREFILTGGFDIDETP